MSADEQEIDGLLRSAAALNAAYTKGHVQPPAVVRRSLQALEAADAQLHCTVLPLPGIAMALADTSAERWTAGAPRPLEGVPFGIKDVFDLEGVLTTGGSTVTGRQPATSTAVAVQRLLDAGAIPVSKDATTEWAVGGPHNLLSGATRNPWNTTRWAGGSSTGSAAAVAAGVFPFALASDAGGSIRIPAAYCGVTGLKTTSGLVPRTGAIPLSWTTETVGPIGASPFDVALMLAVIAGADSGDPQSVDSTFVVPEPRTDLDGLRVGLLGSYFTDHCDRAVLDGYHSMIATLEQLGATCVTTDIPSAADAHLVGYHVLFTEAWAIHAPQAEHFSAYDPVALRRIARGSGTSAQDYFLMLSFRAQLQREFEAAFEAADVLLTPGTPGTAPDLDDLCVHINGTRVPMYSAQSRATVMCNLSGVPALMVPAGLSADRLPVAVQLIGPPLAEDLLLQVASTCRAASEPMPLAPSVSS
jgi:aspartyl-tRNA(Asn)/glutamyl-tRNA(Gln) amidotransferase subunit A